MAKRTVRIPYPIIEKYGYTDKLLAWLYLQENQDAETGVFTVTVRELAAKFGWPRMRAHRFIESLGTSLGQIRDSESPTQSGFPAANGTELGHDLGHTTKYINNPPSTPLKPKINRTSVPDIFPITESMWTWFREKFGSVKQSLVLAETEQFADYHRGKGTLRLDWAASWRTWMRNWQSGKFAGNGQSNPKADPYPEFD